MLVVLTRGPLGMAKLRKATARQVSFPADLIFKKHEAEGGASFKHSFAVALRHLIAHKLAIESGDLILVPRAVRDTVKTVKIPSIGPEGRVLRDQRVLPDRPPQWKISIDSFNASLPKLSIDQMKAHYDAASAVAKNPGNISEMGRAIVVCEHIRIELVNRGIITEGDEYIKWPTTHAPGGDGSLSLDGLPETGPLRELGYRVGRRAAPAEQRCRLLSSVFLEDLPEIVASEGWGRKDTSARLKKLADSIASFTRNAKHKKSANMAEAIRHWEHDLEYLRLEHYVGRFDREWRFPPTTA
ncbi:hypothetical protein [Sinorhizobium meliloti]|uniref:hypothetical protein n=1 Tax=Rhizobium meliloti TaxID=382 RepID=UPI0003FEA101|nr:hypothetical protein [Sinorhizobium meliloti]UFX07689.1 hypothetical protein SmelRRI128_14650 [Sinorhizobium meliloti]